MAANDKEMHILIVGARFYEDLADELLAGACDFLSGHNISFDEVKVPGVFEIPAAISMAYQAQKKYNEHHYDGYVALGCVIRGETSHYDYVCQTSAEGLNNLAMQHALPVGNGILTVENETQAWARASRQQLNKGGAAAAACLSMIHLKNYYNGNY